MLMLFAVGSVSISLPFYTHGLAPHQHPRNLKTGVVLEPAI